MSDDETSLAALLKSRGYLLVRKWMWYEIWMTFNGKPRAGYPPEVMLSLDDVAAFFHALPEQKRAGRESARARFNRRRAERPSRRRGRRSWE
jgi:hypothetical protein